MHREVDATELETEAERHAPVGGRRDMDIVEWESRVSKTAAGTEMEDASRTSETSWVTVGKEARASWAPTASLRKKNRYISLSLTKQKAKTKIKQFEK